MKERQGIVRSRHLLVLSLLLMTSDEVTGIKMSGHSKSNGATEEELTASFFNFMEQPDQEKAEDDR